MIGTFQQERILAQKLLEKASDALVRGEQGTKDAKMQEELDASAERNHPVSARRLHQEAPRSSRVRSTATLSGRQELLAVSHRRRLSASTFLTHCFFNRVAVLSLNMFRIAFFIQLSVHFFHNLDDYLQMSLSFVCFFTHLVIICL